MASYIANKQEFKNYMLGVLKEMLPHLNDTPMNPDEETVIWLYYELIKFVGNI